MDRFGLVQVVFNLVFLANIFYLHRKVSAYRPASSARRAPARAGRDSGAATTLAEEMTVASANRVRDAGHEARAAGREAAAGEAARAEKPESSLDDLIAAAERAESGAVLQSRLRTPGEGARADDLGRTPRAAPAPSPPTAAPRPASPAPAARGGAPSRPIEGGSGSRSDRAPDASRQRAAEDLRANLRRLQARYEGASRVQAMAKPARRALEGVPE